MQELEKGRIGLRHREEKGGSSSSLLVEQWVRLWDCSVRWVLALLHLLLRLALRSPVLRALLCFAGLHAFCAGAEPAPSYCATQLRHPWLLAPRGCGDGSRLTVVLDLDETLVCAYDSQALVPLLHSQAVRSGMHWFQLQCLVYDEADGRQKLNTVVVYERPGLQEFLEKASMFCELVIFTAGVEDYASPLIDKIDSNKRVTSRLYRPATVVTKYNDHVQEVSCHVKDLSCLGRDLKRTVIVDNNPFSFVLQPSNGIPCVPFTGDDPHDQQLLWVLLPLLELLSHEKDVRPVLDATFRMASWFRSRGVPLVET